MTTEDAIGQPAGGEAMQPNAPVSQGALGGA
jgi:hypothetical protein